MMGSIGIPAVEYSLGFPADEQVIGGRFREASSLQRPCNLDAIRLCSNDQAEVEAEMIL